ncbi:hypothetical protein BP5796_03947 [Coleophoma crateriformis]|uniref:Ornithine aminotransferase n=1 Tax=Coleophoma crateriformis TaxID=565419 RepID=A0A3D8SH74_9HELO|nr:hypothetical protein BP5796_03947 [Coleophoma crateriformis]
MEEMTLDDYMSMEAQYSAGIYHPLPVVFDRASGAKVWDTDGKEYLDFVSCFGVVNQGHCHPKIIAALVEQAPKLTLSSRAFYNSQLPLFSKLLSDVFGYEKSLPAQTGAEAVETALKIARRWGYIKKGIPEDQAIILSAEGCYHGRTLATTSLNTSAENRNKYGPMMPGIGATGSSGKVIRFNHIEDLEAVFEENGPLIAAFLTEPVQGDSASRPAEPGYLKAAYDLCKKHGALFMDDEVLAGCGRTGTLLAIEQDGVRPDIVIMGKGLSGGCYPVSVVLASSEIMSVLDVGTHGSTYGGNPLGCAISIAAIKVLVEEDLAGRAAKLGKVFLQALNDLKHPSIKKIQGRGLMLSVILDLDTLDGKTAWDLCLLCRTKGLLLRSAGPASLRMLPPIVIEETDLLAAVNTLGEALTELRSLDHVPGWELKSERGYRPTAL